MVAKKNPVRKIFLTLTAAALLPQGCAPDGPRALVAGDKLLQNGKPGPAVEKLTAAAELMPEEPRAWNLLGLAYHRSGQPQLAAQAYRQALARDRSNLVSVAHFNLGCLLLEQNILPGAIDELRSYTLITNSALGFVKLATAQLRLAQWDAAERTFAAALRLDPKNVEALNGVGVIHAQRKQRDAVQFFNAALVQDPKYAPALLNAGLLAHPSASTRPAALQRFRDYLALAPQSPHAEGVRLLVRQLETELVAVRPGVVTNLNATAQAISIIKSNAVVAALAQQTSAAPVVAVKPPVVVKSNPPVVIVQSNPPVPVPATVAVTSPTLPLIETNVPITVVSVTRSSPPPIAPAQPLTETRAPVPVPVVVAPPETPVATTPDAAATEAVPAPAEEAKRPGFFSRLNPFRGKPKPVVTNDGPRRVVLSPPAPSVEQTPATPLKPVFPRYTYLAPARPVLGNRVEADRAMQQAMSSQRAGNTHEAGLAYQRALSADPAYFEAQYNAALLAFQGGDFKRALAGWETALALNPESINTRYSFALALKQANYPYDAVLELEKILEAKPTDERSHLTLANLYAQQLNETEKARAHYLKILEMDPRHPQAPAIRFWLAANP